MTLAMPCEPLRMALHVYAMQAGIDSPVPDERKVTRGVVEGAAKHFASYARHVYLPAEIAGTTPLLTTR